MDLGWINTFLEVRGKLNMVESYKIFMNTGRLPQPTGWWRWTLGSSTKPNKVLLIFQFRIKIMKSIFMKPTKDQPSATWKDFVHCFESVIAFIIIFPHSSSSIFYLTTYLPLPLRLILFTASLIVNLLFFQNNDLLWFKCLARERRNRRLPKAPRQGAVLKTQLIRKQARNQNTVLVRLGLKLNIQSRQKKLCSS